MYIMLLKILFDNEIININVDSKQKYLFLKWICQMDSKRHKKFINLLMKHINHI